MANIIIPGRTSRFGKTRSEHERNMRREGWGKTMSDEQLDKCTFLEKQTKEKLGMNNSLLDKSQIDRVK